MRNPVISICIPAYRQPQLLRRCLESIVQQGYSGFEVIVTDDSPDDAVKETVASFHDRLPVTYQKNPVSLGSPGNWNAALMIATGKYVKMLHQDDWFRTPDALQQFADAAEQHPAAIFIFSACYNIRPDGTEEKIIASPQQLQQLKDEPECLLLGNFVGAPSTGMFLRALPFMYDPAMKWLVDIDHYIQLQYFQPEAVFIPAPLLNIGIHEAQVTSAVINDKEIVIREHILLFDKLRKDVWRKPQYFDFSWRLMRNFGVRSEKELLELAAGATVPKVLKIIAAWQSVCSPALLKQGIFSKSMMTLAWLRYLLFS